VYQEVKRGRDSLDYLAVHVTQLPVFALSLESHKTKVNRQQACSNSMCFAGSSLSGFMQIVEWLN
jgi:hypothetical protein